MRLFTKRKLIKDLDGFNNIHEAEEHIRSYHINLREKLEIISENKKLKELRNTTVDYSPKYQIKQVMSKIQVIISFFRYN